MIFVSTFSIFQTWFLQRDRLCVGPKMKCSVWWAPPPHAVVTGCPPPFWWPTVSEVRPGEERGARPGLSKSRYLHLITPPTLAISNLYLVQSATLCSQTLSYLINQLDLNIKHLKTHWNTVENFVSFSCQFEFFDSESANTMAQAGCYSDLLLMDNFVALLVVLSSKSQAGACILGSQRSIVHMWLQPAQQSSERIPQWSNQVKVISSDRHQNRQESPLTTCRPPCRSVLTVVRPQKLVSTGILPVCEKSTLTRSRNQEEFIGRNHIRDYRYFDRKGRNLSGTAI